MPYHTNTISHSEGQSNDEGIPGKYIAINDKLKMIAMTPTTLPFLILYGRSKSGAVFLNFKNDNATRKYPITTPIPPASTIHTKAGRPSKGATKASTPKKIIPWVGVLYFG